MSAADEVIIQSRLRVSPWSDPLLSRLPGMQPVSGSWVTIDETYAQQLALKARLLAGEKRGRVLRVLPEGEAPAAELLDEVLADLPPGFSEVGETVVRPDGVPVDTRGAPLEVLSRLLQEDLLILQKDMKNTSEHVLVAGLLCFPASWMLAEKMGRPLTRIHRPVPAYDAGIAARVQRLFDGVRPGRPLWRANALGYARADLHQPRPEDAPRAAPEAVRYVRSERQTVLRLPVTGAVVFAVHTTVVPIEALTAEQRLGCPFV